MFYKHFLFLIFNLSAGKYSVSLDETHFKDLLNQHTSPPAAMVGRYYEMHAHSCI